MPVLGAGATRTGRRPGVARLGHVIRSIERGEPMTGKVTALRERDTTTLQAAIQAAVDAFLSSPRCANPNTRRGYAGVLDRLLTVLGPDRPLASVDGDELADLLDRLWGERAPATWNRNRAAIAGWLSWCVRNRLSAPM